VSNYQPKNTFRAIWFPSWYELDQSIHINEVVEYFFFSSIPAIIYEQINSLGYDGEEVFYSGLLGDESPKRVWAKAIYIQHPILGDIESINTGGLDYSITTRDDRVFLVNAEEFPGKFINEEVDVSDWRINVILRQE
jgi:hypothetical protein